jgi:hypothetical protein
MKFAMGLIQIFRENSQGPAGVSSLGVQGVLPWHTLGSFENFGSEI